MFRRTEILARLPNAYISYAILALSNIILNLVLPANSGTMAAYHLTTTEYRILIFLIDLPLAIIWFTAFYGYKVLRDYSELIKKTDEGPNFARMATGLGWLAWSSPISSILSIILYTIVHNNTGFYTAAIIIEHYVSIIVSVAALTYIGGGTHRLAEHNQRPTINNIRIAIFSFTAFGAMYSYYTIKQVTNTSVNAYHLPMWLILLTVVVPYLYAWYMGLIAAYEIVLHRQKAKGLLYKKGLTYLASGLVVIIASSIIISLLTASTRYLTRLDLNALLLIVYLFLVLYAMGFILVALGTKRLKKIEEV